MFFFLYGPDTFRSRAKLAAIIKKFAETNSDLTPESYSGETLTVSKFTEILSPSLFATKRLIVVEDLIEVADTEVHAVLRKHLPSLAEDIILVLRETNIPDSKSALFKLLNQPGHAQKFDLLTPAATVQWTIEEARLKKVDITSGVAKYLAEVCDLDCWRITAELAKLSALQSQTPITPAQINELVSRSLTAKAFDLLDKVSAGNLAEANRTTSQLLSLGEDPLRLMGLLAYHLRTLIRVTEAKSLGLSKSAIIQSTKLHPFVVQKTLAQAGRMSRTFLIAAFVQVADTDWQIKSGEISSSDGLTRLVTHLTNRG